MSYTKEQVKFNIATNQAWLERAIQVIYELQTADEKNAGETKHYNNVGFNGADARTLSYYAQWINSGKHLSGKHLLKARRLMPKYAGQVLEIINNFQKTKKQAS